MPSHPTPPLPPPTRWPRTLALIIAGLSILGVLAIMPGAWALPEQTPDFQTVPTLTPTPTRPGAGPTATPAPTDTPQPPGTPSAATDTPTAPPGATATATATATTTATATPSPTRPAPAATLPVRPGANSCWAVPTPGFAPERAASLEWSAESDQFLVVPGQTITQRLVVRNTGASPLANVVICNPLNPALLADQPQTTKGQARVEPEGLLAELGSLAAGQTAQVTLSLEIPADYPLGGVIESQAWLLWDSAQRASTELLTWALPPDHLPPTGR
ncbi:MAG: hypothetical protein V9H69_13815 [Anaerolineae bacterium]|jgi:uncharacterized repeat protein (TIGR01451 family)